MYIFIAIGVNNYKPPVSKKPTQLKALYVNGNTTVRIYIYEIRYHFLKNIYHKYTLYTYNNI